ncbi:MAG: hypothetical protein ACTTKO_10155 [Candidatus Limimorpha sp.]
MKKNLPVFLMFMAMAFSACTGTGDNPLIGTWGVTRIEYYTADITGNPIPSTIETFDYTPGASNGIKMTFRADNTGQLEDRSGTSPSVERFTYRYDAREQELYMDKDNESFILYIAELSVNTFTYLNEFESHKMERTYLKRLNNTRTNDARHTKPRPARPGSLLSGVKR